MTSGNYQALFKVIGKLSYFYDEAAAGSTADELAFAALFAQISKPDTIANNEIVLDFSSYASQINNYIYTGGAPLQTALVNAAKNYLTSTLVNSYFVHDVPATNANAAAVVTALIAELTADSSTMTTLASTGMVNFLQQILPAAALPQAADASATYKDSVYSVVTVL